VAVVAAAAAVAVAAAAVVLLRWWWWRRWWLWWWACALVKNTDFLFTSNNYDDTARAYGIPMTGPKYMHSEGLLPSSKAWEKSTNAYLDSLDLSYINNDGNRYFADYGYVICRYRYL
jgi:hypothetical protein